MKIQKLLMLLALPFALMFGGCQPDLPDSSNILPEFVITDANGVALNKVDFAATESNISLVFASNRTWNVNYQSDWCVITPKSQYNPDNEDINTNVTISAFANDTNKARSIDVEIIVDGLPTPVKLSINQLAEGQVEIGKVIFYDNFDKVEAVKDGDYWPYMSAEFGNPTPENQTSVSYDSKNITARANSTSNSDYSDYEGSGSNNMFFGKEGNHLTISGISLAELEGNAMTITFGSEKYSQTYGSAFTPSEFHLYISGDNGAKWSELSYTFAGTEEGRWNVATAQFNLKEVPATLAVKFVADVASSYRMDDLTIYEGGGGTEIDLSKGSADANGGGSSGGTTTGQPTQLVEATIAEFLAASVNTTTWYQLTGEIIDIAKEEYGNFTIKDATGEVYIYGMTNGWVGSNDKSFAEIGLKEGDTVTLGTLRGEYNGTPQGGGNKIPAYYISHTAGSGSGSGGSGEGDGGETIEPGEPIVATIAEFIAAAESKEQWYELTGTITSIEKADYGNIYIQDETGSILIYGLCAEPVASNNKSFASLGLKVNDIVTLHSLRTSYNGTPQGGGTPPAYYISHIEGEEPEGPEIPEGGAMAEVVFAQQGYSNGQSVDGQTIVLDDNISIEFNQAAANNAPAYYDSGSAVRMYQNGSTLDVTAKNGKTIVTIEFTFGSNMYYLDADSGELSAEGAVRTWSGEASNVKFTATGTDKNHRAYVASMKVIYK